MSRRGKCEENRTGAPGSLSLAEQVTPDLGVVSWSPMLPVEIT